ncbi:MAG TPA: ATPase [Cytophagales bacterium]|nr:ATPase [Cytophagales bacterium]HAP59672.1 ATPase [Cytophagales bacterium]
MSKQEQLRQVLDHLKRTFIGKDEIVDLLAICLIARENMFLLGPPGTAKSAIVREFAKAIEGGKNFEYLLTRFTEPNEIFGPFDIRKLRDGELVTNTEGMLPEASMVFLDEIFNANSAILNSLLMALNERVFRRGRETRKLPALTFIGASNVLPEEEVLQALLDRFLVRVPCHYVDPDRLGEVLSAGWQLEQRATTEIPSITTAVIQHMQQECRNVDLSAIRQPYIDLVHHLRSTGIKVSDRRAVKLQNLIAASAYLMGRAEAILPDLWVLKYIWDSEDQIEILAGMVNQVLEKEDSPLAHPQALKNHVPDAEGLLQEVKKLTNIWSGGPSLQEQNALKDKLRYVQSRSEWVPNGEQKTDLQTEIDTLWNRMLQQT